MGEYTVSGFCALIEKLVYGTNGMYIPKEIKGICATIFLYTHPVYHFKTINWVYWTLPFEIVFYFLILFLMFLSERIKIVTLTLITLVAIIIPITKENIFFFYNELPTFIMGYSLYLYLIKVSIGIYVFCCLR